MNSSMPGKSDRQVQDSVLERFHPAVAEWFRGSFQAPTRAQELAWPEILSGHSTLVFAPTGSGKTLAAFLTAIERILFEPARTRKGCTVLYVSPLKALAVDVERNLRAPLNGIAERAAARGDPFHPAKVAVRTGDTPSRERLQMAKNPPDILITTPESLFLVLTSNAAAMLDSVEVVILDEIHVLVGTKRGAHTALSLERVGALSGKPLQRIGLSATQRPLDVVSRYLGGGEPGENWIPRPVSVVDAGATKRYDLKVEIPAEQPVAGQLGTDFHPKPQNGRSAGEGAVSSIWPAIHPRLLELIRSHRSTLLFVNSRRLAERLAASLNELAGEELVRAHHGSLAREERLLIEDQLKAGRLPALVATSTLELGIDMGAVDLVIQVETPPSVSAGIQRIGRASHQAGAISRGILFPKFRGDLLATAAITAAIRSGDVEATRMPMNPLDVLAQQVVSMVVAGYRRVDDIFAVVRRAAPYAQLGRNQFEGLLDMLSGRYPSQQFSSLRPRLTWDRSRGLITPREGSRTLVTANAGTIPDRGLYGVFLADGGHEAGPGKGNRRVGELDEEMVFESRVGEVFLLGASSWRILDITRDQVLVVPAPGQPGKIPFWRADRPPRPLAFGRAIGRLTRELREVPLPAARRRLITEHDLDSQATARLLGYLEDQVKATGVLPDDRTIVLERFRDEMGDWRLCLLSPFGGRVHAPWTLAMSAVLRRAGELEPDVIWSDDGIVLRFSDRERPPEARELLPEPEEIEDLVMGELGGSALFAAVFREAAARALLLPRRRPGRRTPLWMQRKRASDLLEVAARYDSFPIILESYRECLQDIFDLPGLIDLARRVQKREIRLATIDATAPSPFSSSLLFGYVGNYLYDGDAPLAERRAHALSVDQRQLKELLGEGEFRDWLDPGILEALERTLQGLEPGRKASSPDRLHDLLLRIGDLSAEELNERVSVKKPSGDIGDSIAEQEPWTAQLTRELEKDGRAIRLEIGGEPRWIAAEDAGRYRDALAIQLPAGLPDAFLEPVPNPLGEILGRFARSRGPFRSLDAAERYGIDEAFVETALRRLADSGRLLEGEFRPGGHGREWCDSEVLAALRRKSLAHYRNQVEPAPPEALGRLLVNWQGVIGTSTSPPLRAGPEGLLEVLENLQGAVIPASVLETDVLPARLPAYRPEDLDALTAAGEVVWAGVSPLGEKDGKIALFLADDLPTLFPDPSNPPRGGIHEAVLDVLGARGACFFAELHSAVGGGMQRPLLEALWDLVWDGCITNDTLNPLRALLEEKTDRNRALRRVSTFRTRQPVPPPARGRWSLIRAVTSTASKPSPTEYLAAVTGQLLERYGILTRDAVTGEGIVGGFSAVYPVLSAMESQGKIRRGYFVAGSGGSQFAVPGAVERLRDLREPAEGGGNSGVVLSSVDPANPYGLVLPWPKGEARFARTAGAHVVLVDGFLAAYLSGKQKDLTACLPEEEPRRSSVARAAARALAIWSGRTKRPGIGWSPDEIQPAVKGPLAPFLIEAGFLPDGPGFRLPTSRT